MGCAFAKQAVPKEDAFNRNERVSHHTSGRPRTASGKLDFAVAANGLNEKERHRMKVKNKQDGTAISTAAVEEERKREKYRMVAEANPRPSNPPKHLEGEQVAAGWPAWLSAVAGEAIKGWIPRRADSFEKLDKIGQGTYSNVYKARDLDTGKIVALKKVRFDNLEPESVRFMAREIQILRRLDHPNVVKLEGLVTSRMSCSLYLVFEYMEHDLAGLAACPGIKFTEPQVKCFLQQLLCGLDHCHSRGVLHRDIKGSNLLLDNGGILKIADFGLATFFHPDQKQPLTSRVVTLWYRPPELLLGATMYGVAVDLWSTGCILAELLAGKPIMPGRTEVEQLHKIFKLCGSPSEEYWKKSKLPHATIFKPQQPYKRCIAETFKDFSPSALVLLENLLAIEPADRGTASAALKSEFFTTKPLACDPSSLPKYPPSKEFDAKIRDEDARRQRAAGGRARGSDATRRIAAREHSSKAVPAPDANAELAASLQKRRMTSRDASKSKSEKFHPQQEDSAVGFPIDPPRQTEGGGRGHLYDPPGPGRSVALHMTNATGVWGKKPKDEDIRMAPPRSSSRSVKSATLSDFKSQGGYMPQPVADLSSLSTLVAARNNGSGELRKDMSGARHRERGGGDGPQYIKHEQQEVPKPAEEQMEKQRADMVFNGSDNPTLKEPMHRERPESLVFGGQAERIHFSGPLLPPSGNLEDILGDHERKIQQAVRRARHDKGKSLRSTPPSQKTWGVGFDEAPGLGDSYGPTVGSVRLKTTKSHFTGEIIELRETGEGLSSVTENYDRERET